MPHKPILACLFQGAIGSLVLDYKPSKLDIVTHLQYGVTTYSLDPQVAAALWLAIRKIAQIILCAGNSYNPFTTQQPLPTSIPPTRLCAANLAQPLIMMAVAYPYSNPLLIKCNTIDEVFGHVNIICHITTYYMRWMAQGIQTSISQGVDTDWNWGSYWGMSWLNFVDHLGMPIPPKPLAAFPEGVTNYNNKALNNFLALILHPMLSTAALALKEHAHAIVAGEIPIEPPTNILSAFEHFFLANIFLHNY
jgi:hypothetical protein